MSVGWEVRGPAAWVTLDRPDALNAMTFEMYEALFECCERADLEGDVRALVLRGAGDRAFVAGTDIRQFTEFTSGEDGLRYEETIDRIVGRLESVRKPTVALVHGVAMGSGLALAAACDLRVCTPEARFGLPIARTVGNSLSMANYARLAALLGEARLKDVVFRAREIDAREALAIGLAGEVVERDRIESHVEDLCERLAGHAPLTMWATKEALRRLRPEADGADLVREVYESAEFHRRVRAFLGR
jgi:enoyl-CoA hydratase/carnithine racemase